MFGYSPEILESDEICNIAVAAPFVETEVGGVEDWPDDEKGEKDECGRKKDKDGL